MKAIMVMFDSLNRRMLEPYGSQWVQTPNFSRLAEKTVTFDNCYVGSMPCMPARRELHTGRYNFLHRSWGPIEPFDDSMPEMLKDNGIYTHLITDHYHYWEDGGATYHMRYNSFEFARGQENDPWKGHVNGVEIPDTVNNTGTLHHYWVARKHIKNEEDHYQAITFKNGIEFLEDNHMADNWFLHIETFDPHEPYFATERFRDLYKHDYNGKHFDWPPYREVEENEDEIQHMRYESAALHSMCDHYLGKIIDFMDEKNMWDDTMLIVNTDHGFLLGEHGCWAKCWAPFYDEVAHTPLFIWDPRYQKKNCRNQNLVQTIDLAPTVLDYFNIHIPKDMQGKPLKHTIEKNEQVRETALFGLFGGHVNCTDGRFVYMRGPVNDDNDPLYEYTLMPTRHGGGRAFMPKSELQTLELAEPFSFTKDLKLMKMNANATQEVLNSKRQQEFGTLLFDLKADPNQEHPIRNDKVEQKMMTCMKRMMLENDAPQEQFERLWRM